MDVDLTPHIPEVNKPSVLFYFFNSSAYLYSTVFLFMGLIIDWRCPVQAVEASYIQTAAC